MGDGGWGQAVKQWLICNLVKRLIQRNIHCDYALISRVPVMAAKDNMLHIFFPFFFFFHFSKKIKFDVSCF